MFDDYTDLMNMADVQDALGVGRSMAYRLIKEGKIRHLRIGSAIKVPKVYLVDYVEKSCHIDSVAAGLPSESEGGISLNDGIITGKEQSVPGSPVLDAKREAPTEIGVHRHIGSGQQQA